MEHTIHKVVYLCNHYPKRSIIEIAGMFSLPVIEINVATWRAQDLKYLTVNEDDKSFTVDEVPNDWNFGKEVSDIVNYVVYTLNRLAKDEIDIEENILMNWLGGYATHDVFVAMKFMMETGVIGSYIIDDKKDKSKYTFYSLKENASKKWGKKQFKYAKTKQKAKADK